MTGPDIRRERLRHGLTQRALADLLRIHTNTVARLERGELTITPSRADHIRRALADLKPR